MAIAVPLLLAASGASAAIGAAVGISAALATTIATVAFTVTGISAKINEAASSVFGKDLVNVANIFGAAYGTFGGGFGGESMLGAGEAAGSLDAVNGADLMSDTFSKAADATGYAGAGDFGSLADMAGAGMESVNGSDMMSDTFSSAQESGAGGFGSDAPVAASSPSNVFEAINNQAFDPVGQVAATQQPASMIEGTGAAGAQATAPLSPLDPQTLATRDVASVQAQAAAPITANGVQVGSAPPAASLTAPSRSFFDKLIYDQNGNVSASAMRAGGQLIGGIGQGYSAAQKAQMEQDMFDKKMAEQRRVMNQSTGLRVTR